MSAFMYSALLQWKLDMRSPNIIVACYAVPLAFYAFMSGIFTSVMPDMEKTLIPSMTVFAVSMGALIGLPPSLAEIYGSDIRKSYQANGVPLFAGVLAVNISSALHLLIMSLIIWATAPIAFDAALPSDPGQYIAALVVFVAVSLGIASIIGLGVRNTAAVPMVSILVFLPSIMLSGIMFPAELLPESFQQASKVFPAEWGYLLLCDSGMKWENLWPLLIMLAASVSVCVLLLKRIRTR